MIDEFKENFSNGLEIIKQDEDVTINLINQTPTAVFRRWSTKTKGYPNVFAYDYFESKYFYGCGAGYNYMFIDSQGNLCPCDFTMISFGNIKDKPVKDIWEETNSHFCLPGCSCYANKTNDIIAAKKIKTFPLDKEAAKQVVKECPPYDINEIPEFYRKMKVPHIS